MLLWLNGSKSLQQLQHPVESRKAEEEAVGAAHWCLWFRSHIFNNYIYGFKCLGVHRLLSIECIFALIWWQLKALICIYSISGVSVFSPNGTHVLFTASFMKFCILFQPYLGNIFLWLVYIFGSRAKKTPLSLVQKWNRCQKLPPTRPEPFSSVSCWDRVGHHKDIFLTQCQDERTLVGANYALQILLFVSLLFPLGSRWLSSRHFPSSSLWACPPSALSLLYFLTNKDTKLALRVDIK